MPLLPVGGVGTGGGGGGGGGSSTANVTLSKVPTIFRQAVLQPGKDHYNVTTTWRDLRTGRTEVLNTGTVLELGPVQIGNLADFVEIFGTGIVYCGSSTTPTGIGVEQKFQFGKADTEGGAYSAYADIDESTFSSISGGTITFRSKIAAGGAGGRAFADYMPATQVASTWEDMGFVAADVGRWIKIIVLHKKPSTDHPNIEQRYGWRLTLKVDSEVDKTVAVSFAGAKAPGAANFTTTLMIEGSGSSARREQVTCSRFRPRFTRGAGRALSSVTSRRRLLLCHLLTTLRAESKTTALWNRRGLFVQEHIKQLADSTRAYTTFDLSTAFVNVDSKLIGNVNRPGNWLGLFLEDEHAAGGVRRPAAASHNNEFGLNAANGHFEKSNGTDWLEYDPFASGQPWENAYPYGAYADTTFQSGANEDKGIRITLTGKIPSIIGETGDAWELYWYLDDTITAASGVEVVAVVSGGVNFLQIKLKAIDGGASAPTLVAIVAALNSFQPGGAFAGFLCTAGYIGAVNATDKIAAAWGTSGFASDEEASLHFANGGSGTEAVPLTHLDYWAETLTELNESWRAVGEVGLDFASGDLHAVTAYTAPEAGGIEETIKIYRHPGYRQVVPLGRGDVRPAPGADTLGKLYLDHYLRTATFDSEKPVAATQAEGTGTEYTDALFDGIQTAGHRVFAPGHVYYNSATYSWHLSILDQVIFTGYVWATFNFDNLGTNAGLQNNKHWLGDWASADLAAQAIQGYSSATRYYYRNTTTNKIEYLSAVTESIGQHIDYESNALSVVARASHQNPVGEWWLHGQAERWPGGFAAADVWTPTLNTERARLRFASDAAGTTGQFLPNKTYFGRPEDFAEIWQPSGDVSSDADNVASAIRSDQEYLTLPIGTWGVEVVVAGNYSLADAVLGLVAVKGEQ